MNAIDRHACKAGGLRRYGFAAEYLGKPLKNLGEAGQIAACSIVYAQCQAARVGPAQPAGTVLVSGTVHAFCAIGGLQPPYSAAQTGGARA